VLVIWGGLGIANQLLMIQSLNTGTPPALPALDMVDPATVLKIANPQGAGFTSPGMLTNAALTAAGFFLWKGHLL
jgi:hypothetical protein